MRYIDRTNCISIYERGEDKEITSMGALTEEATQIAELEGLGVLKRADRDYKVIRACGLGAYNDILKSLEEVDDYLKHLKDHEDAKL